MIKEEVVVVRRDGGSGKERARLKRWITVCSWVRTCRRVRRWGRAGGSEDEVSAEGWGWIWLLCRDRVGEGGCDCLVAVLLSRPLGTSSRISFWRSPFDDSESANDSASPRKSSTS